MPLGMGSGFPQLISRMISAILCKEEFSPYGEHLQIIQ
jgi:hypothetical protein